MTPSDRPGGSSDMDEDVFVAAFETAALPAAAFRHRDHLRLGYIYVRRHGFEEALQRIADGLRRFTAAHGKPDRYHHTITVAFMALIAERLHDSGDPGSFARFAAANPDLLDVSVLYRYYPRDLLFSERARRGFILPPPQRSAA